MVLLGSSGQMELATGVKTNRVIADKAMPLNMAMAHIIMPSMDRHTLGSSKMIREMAMVYLHGLMEKLITGSIKMMSGKDMDSTSYRMATSMTVSGKMATDQAWQSGST